MSWWTGLRDAVESAASVVLNYYLPGSGLLTEQLVSKGSQRELGSVLGQIAMLGSGFAGGFAGNLSNWGSALDAMGVGAGASAGGAAGGVAGVGAGGAADVGAGAAGGGVAGTSTGVLGGAGAGGVDTGALATAQKMIENGVEPVQAVQMAGITPAQADAAGLPAGAGQTWQDVAVSSGVDYGTGAAPGFTGQNIAGGAGAPATGGGATGGGAIAPAAARTAAGATALPWGSPGNVAGIGSSLYGLMAAGQMQNLAGQASAQADPFGPYRKQYADQLAALTADPSKVTSLPGYQAGLQAVQRAMAAQGYTGSGNMMAALAKYGGDFYNNAVQQYAGLAGAGFNPATAAQLRLQGNLAGVDLAGQSLASLGYTAQRAGNTWPGFGS